MDWFSDHITMLFGGVGGTALVTFVGWWLKSLHKAEPQLQTDIYKARLSDSPVATGSNISQRVNSPDISFAFPVVPSGAPGRERYDEWRELIHELHEAFNQIGYAFLPINVITPGVEVNDYQAGIRRGNRVIRNRLFIADALERGKVPEKYQGLVTYAISARNPREPDQRGCPTMNGFDMKVRAFEDELMEIARRDIGLSSVSRTQTGIAKTESPQPNLRYAGSKQKFVFVSPHAIEGICDPRTEEERKESVQALILKFENRIVEGRNIARALNVIAKIRFQSSDGRTERLVDYGLWLNSPCQTTSIGIGDTVELVLMSFVNNTLVTFSDRRSMNHAFTSEFSYFEDGVVTGLDLIEITLIDKNSQASLTWRFKIWLEGNKFCVAVA